MTLERRRYTRIPFRVEAEVKIKEILYKVETLENLSIGGCLLPLRQEIQTGTPCEITILLVGTNPQTHVKVEGHVLRADTDNVAIRFTHIDPDSLLHLKSIIRYNAPDTDAVEKEMMKHPTPR
ncbi:MAG: PilZ domain-containing protein [Deltaproteobacteria bacterium]|nr:PilZ domain-containing protein [Deltaproteobacteria bacterium]